MIQNKNFFNIDLTAVVDEAYSEFYTQAIVGEKMGPNHALNIAETYIFGLFFHRFLSFLGSAVFQPDCAQSGLPACCDRGAIEI